MKEIMEKSGMMKSPENSGMGKDKNKSRSTTRDRVPPNAIVLEATQSTSATTIYQNVLQKVGQEQTEQNCLEQANLMEVDSEVAFKLTESIVNVTEKPNRFSSSSEDQVDTSDELIEFDMDINDRFIADCAKEVATSQAKQKAGGNASKDKSSEQPNPRNKAEEIIKQVENDAAYTRYVQ